MTGNNKKRSRHHPHDSNWDQHRRGGGGRVGRRSGGGSGGSRNPRRGGPGVLLTCDGGRERKCRIEGLDILRHYYYALSEKIEEGSGGRGKEDSSQGGGASKRDVAGIAAAPSAEGDCERRELSLEEEIALLKGGASAEDVLRGPDDAAGGSDRKGNMTSPFAVYDTGCKGTVFVMCTLPHCNLVPELRKGAATSDDGMNDEIIKETSSRSNDLGNCEGSTHSKKRKVEAQGGIEGEKVGGAHATPRWDPLDTVHRIMNDLAHPTAPSVSDAPESRFVTRMIPIQATCFASLEEIRHTAQLLLNRYLFREIIAGGKKQATFGIVFKRRNCSHLKRDGVIDTVAEVVKELQKAYLVGENGDSGRHNAAPSGTPELSVDLKNPDYTIQIEVCKTLCGMSVVPKITSFHKFNLFEMRQQNKEEDE